MTTLAAARRAIAEKAIRDRGPLAAIMAAPSEESAVLRASLVLGRHNVIQVQRHDECDAATFYYPNPVSAADVTQALIGWSLLSTRPGGVAS